MGGRAYRKIVGMRRIASGNSLLESLYVENFLIGYTSTRTRLAVCLPPDQDALLPQMAGAGIEALSAATKLLADG